MNIVTEIESKFSEDIDCKLGGNKEYLKAEKELHDFIADNISADKEEQYEQLIGKLTSTVGHISFDTGIRFGAKLTVELLK